MQIAEVKTIIIGVLAFIGSLIIRKIFNDTFKNFDFSLKNIYQQLSRLTQYIFVVLLIKTAHFIRPKETNTIAISMLLALVIILPIMIAKSTKENNAKTRMG